MTGLVGVTLAQTSCHAADVEVVGHGGADEYYLGTPGAGYQPYAGEPYEVGPNGEQPKNNYDYAWGLASDGRYIWLGASAGVAAAAESQIYFLLTEPAPPREEVSAMGTQYRVVEFGASQYPNVVANLKPLLGDWRPPRIYQYDTVTRQMIERTPNDPLLYLTFGLRSAGVKNGVALLAGPSMVYTGIFLFAFDARTGEYLGSRLDLRYSNIRRWVNARGGLYTSALNTVQTEVRGSVLKWTGSRNAPFRFEVVGHLDNEGAYLAEHDGRLYVGTWPSFSLVTLLPALMNMQFPEQSPVCGLWMSPPLTNRGLTAEHADSWQKVWTPETYEPDPILKYGYSMGALASYDGQLYFTTLHFPGTGLKAFLNHYEAQPPGDFALTERTPLILRGDQFDTPGQTTTELLYGNAEEFVFTPSDDPPVIVDGIVQGTWSATPTLMGGAGIYGTAGFSDIDNRYVWSAEVHRGKLYFGTFDHEGASRIKAILDEVELAAAEMREPDLVSDGRDQIGADLYRFSNHSSPAEAVTRNAFGKYAIHGFRNMVSTPTGLFLGTANSQNLLTNLNDSLPNGGWELLRLIEE